MKLEYIDTLILAMKEEYDNYEVERMLSGNETRSSLLEKVNMNI